MKIINKVAVKFLTLALASSLVACGGGGSDDSSDGNSNNGGGNAGNTNSAPTLSVSSDFELQELSTESLSFNVSDSDGDTVTTTVTSSSNYLSAVVSGDNLVLTTNEVDKDEEVTLTINASDGELSTTKNISVKIVDVPLPELVLNVSKTASLSEYETLDLDLELSEGLTPKITSQDTNVLLAKYENDKITLQAFEVEDDTDVTVLIELENDEGQYKSETVTVSVLNNPNISDAELSISLEENEIGNVIIYNSEKNYLSVDVSSTDAEDKLTWSFDSIKGLTEDDDLYLNSAEKDGDYLKISMKDFDYTNGYFEYDVVLTVSNGEKYSNETFRVKAIAQENSKPLISLDYEQTYKGIGLIEVGTSKTFSFDIIDDKINEIVLLPEATNESINDADFTYSIDVENKQITINANSSVIGDRFSLFVYYKDGQYQSATYFLFETIKVLGDYEKTILEKVENTYQKIASLKEYQYLAEFYSEVLENRNLISESLQNKILIGSKINDSFYFDLSNSNADLMYRCMLFGEFDETDPQNCYATIDEIESTTNDYIDASARAYTLKAYDYIESLEPLTVDLLPSFEFEDSLYLYDTDKNLYSKFAGNEKYGEFVNGEFSFYEEYSFLKAVVEKSLSKSVKVYKSDI